MAAQKGREFLLQIGDGGSPATFSNLGGFRTNAFRMNNEEVDITNKDSNGFRELLEGAGVQSVSITGAGVFTDSAAQSRAWDNARNKTFDDYAMVIKGLGRVEGRFQLSSFEFGGEHNAEETFTITLSSSGQTNFIAE